MADLEALGDAVTGGIVGRAVESEASEGGDGHTHERHCLNCGTELLGPHCHVCGQHAHVHRTLGAFWHDLLHGVLHFEGKTWRTLPLLALKPGELTRRYIEGERANFVSPIALFLFAVFLMFATVNAIGGPFKMSDTAPASTPQSREELQKEFEEARAETAQQLRRLESQRAEAVAAGRPTASIDAKMADVRQGSVIQDGIFTTMGVDTDSAKPLPAPAAAGGKSGGDRVADNVSGAANRVIPGGFDAAYRKAKENPSLLAYKLQNNAYKFSWALIPISVPFVWLLFLHRRRYRAYRAYDHTVFVTYSLSFMTLGFVALSLLRLVGIPGGWIFFAIAALPPIHMYRQLRGAYALSRWSAGWRTLVLLILSLTAAAIFFALLLTMGVLG